MVASGFDPPIEFFLGGKKLTYFADVGWNAEVCMAVYAGGSESSEPRQRLTATHSESLLLHSWSVFFLGSFASSEPLPPVPGTCSSRLLHRGPTNFRSNIEYYRYRYLSVLVTSLPTLQCIEISLLGFHRFGV